MHALSHPVVSRWADEFAFHGADPRRRTSAEVDFGATWRWGTSNDAWRVAWLRDTGELYVCRADGPDGACSDVHVLAVVEREADVDAMLAGWQERRFDPDGLAWLTGRVAPLAVA